MCDDKSPAKTTDPLPCPFCGERPEIARHFKEEMYRLEHRCAAVGPIIIDWRDDVPALLRMWNRRVK